MIELSEAAVLAQEINETNHGDPQKYHDLLADKVIDEAAGFGGLVELKDQYFVGLQGKLGQFIQ